MCDYGKKKIFVFNWTYRNQKPRHSIQILSKLLLLVSIYTMKNCLRYYRENKLYWFDNNTWYDETVHHRLQITIYRWTTNTDYKYRLQIAQFECSNNLTFMQIFQPNYIFNTTFYNVFIYSNFKLILDKQSHLLQHCQNIVLHTHDYPYMRSSKW